MSAITVIVLIFALIGLVDNCFGNKLGFGKEFAKGFSLFGPMALSMLGMLVISPAIGVWLKPVFDGFYSFCGVDPSIIPSSLFANDMGGANLSLEVCKSQAVGNFNAYVVSSMMGCVISFTIPLVVGIVQPHQRKEVFFGLLCGIVTIPVGCFVSGLICGLTELQTLVDLLPLIILAAALCLALVFFQNACIKVFSVFGFLIKIISTVGIACAIFTFLTKIEICEYFDTLENAAFVCVNACVTLSGALPFMYLIAKIFNKPIDKIGLKTGLDSVSAVTLLSTMVTNVSTFDAIPNMNKKGVVLNSAFAVSAAFVFGGHLAFTMAYDPNYVLPVIVGKLISGICALVLAAVLYKDKKEDPVV